MSPTEFTHSPVIPIAAPFDLTDYPELAGISGISGTGLVARIGVGSYATRTITGTTNQVNVADGNGVSGNPTLSLPQNIHTAATPTFAGLTLSSLTAGRIPYTSTGGLLAITSNLVWDNPNGRLGLGGVPSPSATLEVSGNVVASGVGSTSTSAHRLFCTAKEQLSLTIGPSVSVAGATANESSGVLRFLGVGIRHGDLGFYPNGGASGDAGHFRFMISSSLLGSTPTAKLGVSTLYATTNLLVGTPTDSTNYKARVVGSAAIGSTVYEANFITLHVGMRTAADNYASIRMNTQTSNRGWTFDTFDDGTTSEFFQIYSAVAAATRLKITHAGNVLLGGASETASSGVLQLPTGTTAATGILWGTDTNLYRSAANTLKTDDALTIADTTASTSSTTGALIVSGGVGIAKDSWINSVRIGRGNNALSTNTVLGAGALAGANSGSAGNTAIGYQALAANTTGNGNVAIGGNAQSTSTTGVANISVGNGNLGANNGLYNVAIGHASQDTATSNYNVSVGGLTLRAATGLSNVAIGYQAGQTVSSGYQNTIVGTSAGASTTTAWANTMVGYQAGYHSTGLNNVFVGYNSGINVIAGSYNTLVGSSTWPASTTINNNIVLSDGQGNIKYRYDATNVTYTANSGYHSFVSTGSAEQVRVTHTASANRYITLTGSNGGNPTIDVSAGSLAITPATVFASTISALAITGNSFIPNSATIPTNGMYLEAANNPAFAANSTKIFEYDSTGVQIAGTVTTTGGATFHTTSTALTDGAGAGAGTLTNAPAAGDPTKWIGINDNGTTRYIPAW